MKVVVVGTPLDGIKIYGPFEDADDAVGWASTEVDKNDSWWVASVEEP